MSSKICLTEVMVLKMRKMIINLNRLAPLALNTTILSNSFPVSDIGQMKLKVLNWLRRFDTFCFLDNQQYQIAPHTHECIVGAGIRRRVIGNGKGAPDELQRFIDAGKTWLFGHLCYDLKCDPERVSSTLPDGIQF